MAQALLDRDTLSEVIKGRDTSVAQRAQKYHLTHKRFTFSIITRYEILRGLKAKEAIQQITVFEDRCRESRILALTDTVVVQAAEIYA
jgi:tRNA(fMet)-specific endonuclease VapC